jgi:hypothetical protein
VVDRVFPLDEAADAHRRMEEAEQFGKIVVRIASSVDRHRRGWGTTLSRSH